MQNLVAALPEELRREIDRATASTLASHQRELLPLHRRAIYNVFEAHGRREGITHLALLTANYVLPLWSQARPSDDLPRRLLTCAKAVLKGIGSRAMAEKEASEGWEQLEMLGHEPEDDLLPAIYAADAAREALVCALGRDPFGDALITDRTTDSDLDPWCSDTALWAAQAWAGGTWERTSDPARRQEFWHWWLTEAIPQAWGNAASPADSTN